MNKGLIYKLTSPFNNQIFFSICKFRLHMIIISETCNEGSNCSTSNPEEF